jgi:hypothetical protein
VVSRANPSNIERATIVVVMSFDTPTAIVVLELTWLLHKSPTT